jgi:hypothetical protein
MGESKLNSELIERLKSIEMRLKESNTWFRLLENYCRSLNHDIFMINMSLEDECSTICRIQIDSWLCEIEKQQTLNMKFEAIVSKLIAISDEDCFNEELNHHFSHISELDASIQDGYQSGRANRPVDGLMPCIVGENLEKDISKIEISCLRTLSNWKEWTERITEHIILVNKLVTLFPASHPFSSIPCSISILLNQISKFIVEQNKLEKTLEILTNSSTDSHDAIFGLDVLIIMEKLCPIPICGDEQ